jgi:hypothetical protein
MPQHVILPSVNMQNVIISNVILPNVVAPWRSLTNGFVVNDCRRVDSFRRDDLTDDPTDDVTGGSGYKTVFSLLPTITHNQQPSLIFVGKACGLYYKM